MKLKYRLLLTVLMPALFLIVLGGGFFIHSLKKNHLDQFQRHLQAEMDALVLRIDHLNAQSIETAYYMKMLQEKGLFGQREASFHFCHQVLEHLPHITCAYIIYQPNADEQDASQIKTATLYNDPQGRFAAIWERDSEGQGRIKPIAFNESNLSILYPSLMEKLTEASSSNFTISEPFCDSLNNVTIDYCVPIYSPKHEYLGICGVTQQARVFQELLAPLQEKGADGLYLLSEGGRIIATTLEDEFKTVSLEDIYFDDKGQIIKNLYTREEGHRIIDPNKQLQMTRHKPNLGFSYLVKKHYKKGIRNKKGIFLDNLLGKTAIIGVEPMAHGPWNLIHVKLLERVFRDIDQQIWKTGSFIGLFLIVLTASLSLAAVRLSRNLGWMELQLKQLDAPEPPDTENASLSLYFSEEEAQLWKMLLLLTQHYRNAIKVLSQYQKQSSLLAIALLQKVQSEETQLRVCLDQTETFRNQMEGISSSTDSLREGVETINKETSMHFLMVDKLYEELLNLVQMVKGISEQAEFFTNQLMGLLEKNQDVHKGIESISKIASQMNLLALNAAIEAEKASEHGIGFSAVSRKMGRLADQTLSSTSSIQAHLQQGLLAIDSSISEMNRFSEKLNQSVRTSEHLCKQAESLNKQSHRSSVKFYSMTQNAQMQSEEISQAYHILVELKENINRLHQSAYGIQSHVQRLLENLKQTEKKFIQESRLGH